MTLAPVASYPPRMLETIDALADLSGRYDILLCDIWGVIHDGRDAFPVACDALTAWRETVGPVILISNAARPHPPVIEQLDGLGVPRAAYSALISSGDVTRRLLAERAPGPAYRIGQARDGPLYDGLGLSFVTSLDEAAFISCTGPNDDDVETPEDYRTMLAQAARLRLPMICANPDKVVQRGDRLIYCGGALADLFTSLGGEVEMAGKPHAPIYEAALTRARELAGQPVDPARVLAIGDGLATDIAGANAQGLDALFVVGGIHGAETRDAAGGLDAPAAEALLAASGLSAAYAMDALA
ncbi:MAG TPA: TIGR01459 family HAD-type hydrolase [Caulobacteraceae bacterium]|nr:TIGR01459 family HAD-type hydrolase [Caulobacteraceae bacterium]